MFLVIFISYILLGTLFTSALIQWAGLSHKDSMPVVFFWPFFAILVLSMWIWKQTSWYKIKKRKKRFRVLIAEDNESEEIFIQRLKRL